MHLILGAMIYNMWAYGENLAFCTFILILRGSTPTSLNIALPLIKNISKPAVRCRGAATV